MQTRLSIIIPTLNESTQIEFYLKKLQALRQQGHEVIIVDGGSYDNTVSLASSLCDRVIHSKKSRAIQMNLGVTLATGDYFIFLHADTLLPKEFITIFSEINNSDNSWGRFDIKLSGKNLLFRLIERCINFRSRVTGIATGDQVIFVGRELFQSIKGFPEIAIMEDIAISKILLKQSKPICFKAQVISSSRRWEKNGIIKTILKMWLMRFLYFLNYDTNKLEKIYS